MGDVCARWVTPSDSDNESGAQYNARYTAAQQGANIGNLTAEETRKAGSSRAFRIGTYFTSPTGVLNTAPRRGSKLVGM